MASINEIDSRMKQEFNEFKELLKYMHECYDKMDDGDTDAVYEKDVIIGFGNRIAHAKGGAATYTALEDAIQYILEQEYEEYEEEETKPIGRIVKSYEIDYTGGGIYLVVGQFVSGEWFSAATPDEDDSIGLYATEGQAQECLADDMEFLIMGDSAKYIMVWDEILTDYVEKNGDFSACVPKWREGLYKGV